MSDRNNRNASGPAYSGLQLSSGGRNGGADSEGGTPLQMPNGGGDAYRRDWSGGWGMGPPAPEGVLNRPIPNAWSHETEGIARMQLQREQANREAFIKKPIHGQFMPRVPNPSVEEIAGAYIDAQKQAEVETEPIYRLTSFIANSKFSSAPTTAQSRLNWGLAFMGSGAAGMIILNDENLQNVVSMRLNPFTVPVEMVQGLYYGTLQLQVNSFSAVEMSTYGYSGGINAMASTLFHFDCSWAVSGTNSAIAIVTPLNPQYIFTRPSGVPNNAWTVSLRSPLSAANLMWPPIVITGVVVTPSNPLVVTLPVLTSSLSGLIATIDTPGLNMTYGAYGTPYTATVTGANTLSFGALNGVGLTAGTSIDLCFLHRVSIMNFRLDSLDKQASVTDSTRVLKTVAN